MTREEKIAAIKRQEKILAIQEMEAKLAASESETPLRFKHTVSEDSDDIKALLVGGAEGVTLGHAAEIAAGAETILDITKGDLTLGSFGESYIGKRNTYEDAIEDLEKNNPKSFTTGNIVGTATTGGVALGLGGIPATVATGLAAGLGYAEPKKRSETLSLDEAADALVKAGGYEVVGNIIPVGGGKLLDVGSAKAAGMYKEYMAGTLAEALGYAGKIKKELNTKLRQSGRSMQDWAENLFSVKDKKGRELI